MTIDVPDVFPANFERPSEALLKFMTQFTDVCVRLTARYRQINGRELFDAFIRDGVNSVHCTGESKTRPIQRDSDIPELGEESSDEMDAPPADPVYMEDDLPGAWVVCRLNIEKLGFITLRSHHFKQGPAGEPSIADELMRFVVRWLEDQLHSVPK